MWIVAFRDLEARRRRVAIGVVATAMVFAITLLLAGVSAAMKNEIRRTVGSLRVDTWVVPKGVTGPFTSWRTIAATRTSDVASAPGVTAAAPVALFRQTTRTPTVKDVNVIGYEPGRLGAPPIASGRALAQDGEIVVDRALGKHLGDVVTLTGKPFHVVGITHGLTYFAGIPATFLTLHDAQRLVYEGAPFATAIVTRGVPKQLPADLTAVDNAQVRSDMARPIRQAASTIGFLNILLWIIAAGIIGAILYMSALERIRDFAVIKARARPTLRRRRTRHPSGRARRSRRPIVASRSWRAHRAARPDVGRDAGVRVLAACSSSRLSVGLVGEHRRTAPRGVGRPRARVRGLTMRTNDDRIRDHTGADLVIDDLDGRVLERRLRGAADRRSRTSASRSASS